MIQANYSQNRKELLLFRFQVPRLYRTGRSDWTLRYFFDPVVAINSVAWPINPRGLFLLRKYDHWKVDLSSEIFYWYSVKQRFLLVLKKTTENNKIVACLAIQISTGIVVNKRIAFPRQGNISSYDLVGWRTGSNIFIRGIYVSRECSTDSSWKFKIKKLDKNPNNNNK